MPRKSKDLVARAERIVRAWKMSHPEKTFFGRTLDAFVETLRPCREVRVKLANIASEKRVLLTQRRNYDNAFRPLLINIVHAVRGDPDVGENDPMYASMGYVAKNRRRKPGRKKKKAGAKG
jgi:hypothetical protein